MIYCGIAKLGIVSPVRTVTKFTLYQTKKTGMWYPVRISNCCPNIAANVTKSDSTNDPRSGVLFNILWVEWNSSTWDRTLLRIPAIHTASAGVHNRWTSYGISKWASVSFIDIFVDNGSMVYSNPDVGRFGNATKYQRQYSVYEMHLLTPGKTSG